jgi:hypothetical protein
MKPKRYTSWNQVASALAASRTALVEQRKREDWPAPRTMPRDGMTARQVDAIRRWRESLPRAGQVASDPVSQDIHLAHRREQTALMKVRRELLQGRYIEAALHEQAMVALADVYVRSCESLPTTIATSVPDLTPEQRGTLERVIAEQITEHRRRLASEETLTLTLPATSKCVPFSPPPA